jgi:hypothetical protein
MGLKGMRERAALRGGDVPNPKRARNRHNHPSGVRTPTHDEPPIARARTLLVEDHAAVGQAIAGMFKQQADSTLSGRQPH